MEVRTQSRLGCRIHHTHPHVVLLAFDAGTVQIPGYVPKSPGNKRMLIGRITLYSVPSSDVRGNDVLLETVETIRKGNGYGHDQGVIALLLGKTKEKRGKKVRLIKDREVWTTKRSDIIEKATTQRRGRIVTSDSTGSIVGKYYCL